MTVALHLVEDYFIKNLKINYVLVRCRRKIKIFLVTPSGHTKL
jgi:hypothetical protein